MTAAKPPRRPRGPCKCLSIARLSIPTALLALVIAVWTGTWNRAIWWQAPGSKLTIEAARGGIEVSLWADPQPAHWVGWHVARADGDPVVWWFGYYSVRAGHGVAGEHLLITPLWTLALVTGAASVWSWLRWLRQRRIRKGAGSGVCPECGYLRGDIPQPLPCPECGRAHTAPAI